MSTQKQIEANRLNAQKSTGPRTAAGKAASSRNAITHGLCAQFAVIPGEDPEAFADLLAQLRTEHQPQTATEDILVERMATTHWQLRRIAALQQAVWTEGLLDTQRDGADDAIGAYWSRVAIFDSLARHESRLERVFHRSLCDLQRLQTGRRRPEPEPKPPAPPRPNPQIPTKRTQFESDPGTEHSTPAPQIPDPNPQIPIDTSPRRDYTA